MGETEFLKVRYQPLFFQGLEKYKFAWHCICSFETTNKQLQNIYWGAGKSLARPRRKHSAPVKSVKGRGMD